MANETTPQHNYPKHLDPWMVEIMGKYFYSQLVGDDYKKRCAAGQQTPKIFVYDDITLTEDNAADIIRKIFLDSTWETVATRDGKLKINFFAGKDLVAFVDGKEFYRNVKGDLMISYDVKDTS